MPDATLGKMCNAWIFLNEDEPIVNGQRVLYDNPQSAYQRLISHNVYQSVDMLFLCFAQIVPTSSSTTPTGDGSSYTVQIGYSGHPEHANPPTYTNQDYMNFIIRDSRANNPNIKIGVTLGYGNNDMINQIFNNSDFTPEQNAANFAANLVAYLKSYNIDGFDIDWEYPLSDYTVEANMTALLNAVGAAFGKETSKKLFLTLAPNVTDNLNASAVNASVDFLSLQLYGAASKQGFIDAGIDENLLAYGAHFENGQGFQSAQEAYQGYVSGGYEIATQWRLNSSNYVYEQDQQIEFYKLIYGS